MSDDGVRQTLERRRNAAIRTILRYKEEHVDGHVHDSTGAELRKVVLEELNDLTEVAFALIESVRGDGVVVNEAFLEKIDDIHRWFRESTPERVP